eukprot:TRINITY_DN49337_c0_g1_i1.p1 TRINITY_DN49337_c0_g1~~TRINITY_DN49337_c0_g1_i1.p1  ORF type:complete len:454 (+),score=48.38 TRINITY_DN49337_c0_g1_i1:73-1434(+)
MQRRRPFPFPVCACTADAPPTTVCSLAAAAAVFGVFTLVRGTRGGSSCLGDGDLHAGLCEAWNRHASLSSETERVRLLSGRFEMGAQLIPLRRRFDPALVEDDVAESLHLDFPEDGPNFLNVLPQQALLCFDPARKPQEACRPSSGDNMAVPRGRGEPDAPQVCPKLEDADISLKSSECGGNTTGYLALVVASPEPSCRHHIFLVPSPGDMQTQVLTENALALAFAFSVRASPRMYLSFDSIGAGALLNHLHWQGTVMPTNVGDVFPFDAYIQHGGLQAAADPRGPVSLSVAQAWPLRAWVFTWEMPAILSVDSSLVERRLAEISHSFILQLIELEIPHHVVIFPRGTRLAVFPRRRHSSGPQPDIAALHDENIGSHGALGWWLTSGQEEFGEIDVGSAEVALQRLSLPVSGERAVEQALRSSGWQLRPNIVRASESRLRPRPRMAQPSAKRS